MMNEEVTYKVQFALVRYLHLSCREGITRMGRAIVPFMLVVGSQDVSTWKIAPITDSGKEKRPESTKVQIQEVIKNF